MAARRRPAVLHAQGMLPRLRGTDRRRLVRHRPRLTAGVPGEQSAPRPEESEAQGDIVRLAVRTLPRRVAGGGRREARERRNEMVGWLTEANAEVFLERGSDGVW